MGWLAAAASLAGSIIGGNAQKSAAKYAANSQLNLQQQEFDQLQGQEANYRQQIQQMLPYLQGPTGAAMAFRNQNNQLSPGQGTFFGGQTIGPNGSSISSNQNYLSQGMPGTSGVPFFQGQSRLAPGISGSGGTLTMNPAKPNPGMG